MVHTFELSKMISKEMFDTVIGLLKMKYYHGCWATKDYADKGFPLIHLYKFKREDVRTDAQADSDLTHYYMITLSINTANMFSGSGDAHFSQNILSFTPIFVRAVYHNIFELLPCLEIHPEWCMDSCLEEAENDNTITNENLLDEKKARNRQWLALNAFKARRIDFAFDLKRMNRQYLALINRGYSLCEKFYERSYFEDKDVQEEASDNEPDVPDSEEILKMMDKADTADSKEQTDSGYHSDVKYVYYKGKGVNINIYHKKTEIQEKHLHHDPDSDYDFLRIEVQVKKSKLNAIVSKFGLNKGELDGRELQYLISPEVEEYVLHSYVKRLTGTGFYVTYERAMKTIDASGYTKAKKERLKKIVEAVAKKHGIAKVLEQVESGRITDLGKPETVRQYLRDIHGLGINPVIISARMNIPKQTLKNQSGGKDLSESILPNLLDVLSAYGEQIKDEQQYGVQLTDEDIKEIGKL